jgi:hypothetical protein
VTVGLGGHGVHFGKHVSSVLKLHPAEISNLITGPLHLPGTKHYSAPSMSWAAAYSTTFLDR